MTKALMKARWLDRLQAVVVVTCGLGTAAGILTGAPDPGHFLALAIAMVFGYGVASLVSDLMDGLLAGLRDRLDSDAGAAALRAIQDQPED
ncbi:hypothetical protein [Streptomyces caniscabiei]|uniref:hypothetical protein n=1 Tax=Streptomyces caniscabiei TaxID=2746961 RepID=UPI0029A534EA|nr:hypothetical protein [Streptomyces caniscabiei]MDX2948865.1 hypothetical protein [Streptomyces caniscabiei]